MERERIWCQPAEKFKQWGATAVKGMMDMGLTLHGEEKVPLPAGYRRNKAMRLWLA
jgi:hypothetical protein